MDESSHLAAEFMRNIPPPKEIVASAIAKGLAGQNGDKKFIKKNFSLLVGKLESDAYKTYLTAQKTAWKKSIRFYFGQNLKATATSAEAIEYIGSRFDDFDTFFLSVSQSRKSRAGSTFEDIIRELFKRLDYPFDEQQIINGKPDFLMPGRAYYDQNAMECIVFTAKRTLRERWRQIVTEGTKGLGFFLATIDVDVSENNLDEMKKNKIYLVVPAQLKTRIEHYKNAGNVISFEDFFEGYLDPAMKRWKKAGVI